MKKPGHKKPSGELSLIRHFRAHAPTHPWLKVGPGHDCAVLEWPGNRDVAFKIDQVVEGTHFLLSGPEAATPYQVGWKAMAKACSDIAATGFWPVAATVAVNLKKGSPDTIPRELYRGLVACCDRFGFGLAGGDISASDNGLSVVVSLLGEGPKNGAWLRSGAKPGDLLFVTGALGGSRAKRHLNFIPRLEEARMIRSILPSGVHACIDITDGLSRDLRHICEESGTGAILFEDKIPCSKEIIKAYTKRKSPIEHALEDGEDFELLMAIAPRAARKLHAQCELKVPLTQIGFVEAGTSGYNLVDSRGVRRPLPDVGFEHQA